MSVEGDGAEPGPGFLLWHATLRWQRAVTAALRPLGLTHVQFVLLAGVWWLDSRGTSPSQRELADHAGTDVMMTSQVVRTLEHRDWVRRASDPGDARVKRLRVTDAGRRLAIEAVEAVEAVDRGFFGATDPVPLLRTLAQRDS